MHEFLIGLGIMWAMVVIIVSMIGYFRFRKEIIKEWKQWRDDVATTKIMKFYRSQNKNDDM